MKESELDELESKLDKLIGLLDQLKLENLALRKQNRSLGNENVVLLDKKKKTAGSIKALVQQLQDELLCQTQK